MLGIGKARRARLLVAASGVAGLGMWASVSGFAVNAASAAEDDDRQQEVDPQNGNRYHAADLDGQTRFTGEGEVWPPRPVDAGAPTRLDQPNPPRYELEPLAQQLAEGADLLALLGEHWTVHEVATNINDGKDESQGQGQGNTGSDRSIVTFYSRSTNQSIQVELTGERIQNIETIAPTVNQLPVTPGEAEEATAIARQYWLDQGHDRANELEGFVIMAFQPGGALYDVRMVYVSFHENADVKPEFVTWVDLTNGVVSHGREEN